MYGQASRYHSYLSMVDDCQSNEASTSASSSHQSSPRTKTMRRGMFKEPRHHQDRVADGYTCGGRDYREQSRYPMDANNERYYENWDGDDDSCMSSVCYSNTSAASDDQFDDVDTDENAV